MGILDRFNKRRTSNGSITIKSLENNKRALTNKERAGEGDIEGNYLILLAIIFG